MALDLREQFPLAPLSTLGVGGPARYYARVTSEDSVREAVEYWRKALTAEDDGEDLDRAVVERKIREAQASLNDAAQVKRP